MGKSLDIIKAPKQKPVNPHNVDDKTREHDKDSFFNSMPKEEKSDPLLFYLILGLCAIILLVALSVWLIYKSLSGNKGQGAQTSSSQTQSPTSSASATEATSSTTQSTSSEAAAAVDKTKVKIRIVNGNGRTGEAGLMKKALEDDGFSQITTGNAASRYSTTVIYYNTGKLSEAKAIEKIVANKYETSLKEDTNITKDNDVVVALGAK